jgi:serine/threonine protein kinase
MPAEAATHPTPDELAAFDAGLLSPPEHNAVAAHVDGCAACCRTLQGLPETPLAALVRAYGTSLEGPSIPPELAAHPRYRVLAPVGEGGMGVVYKAVHRAMDRVVALKVLRPHLTGRPDFLDRFRKEVQAAARLNHPNIATAHDADEAGGLHFLVTEFVEGQSLHELLRQRGPVPVAEARELVRQAALGLAHAHDRGLSHRDVKPANLLRTTPGRVKVVDFGLARLPRDAAETPAGSSPVVGTPDYMAPEQARDPESADARADVYGLGCTLYELLTGRPPFADGTVLQRLLAHQERTSRPVRELRPDVPATVAALLTRMLAKEPARRPTMEEVARTLAEPDAPLQNTSYGSRSVVPVALALLALVAVGGTLAFRFWPGTAPTAPATPAEVASTPSAPTPAAVLSAEQLRQQRQEMRDRTVEWVRHHNRWRPDAPIVANIARQIDSGLPGHEGFQVILGSGLVRSGKPTMLAAHPGGWFSFEVDEAGAPLKLSPTGSVFHAYQTGDETRLARPAVELSGLRLDQTDPLPRGEKITGEVAYRIPERSPTPLFLRLVHYPTAGKLRSTAMHYPKPPLHDGDGTLRFEFGGLDPERTRFDEVVVIFVDLATRVDGRTVVVSNTLASLVRAAPRR